MKEYSKTDFIHALQQIGLKKGDVVLVSTQLFALGKMTGMSSKKEYLEALLDAFFQVLGRKEGTVAVNAYTFQVGRYGVPFELTETKCMTGLFSQYVLSHPENLRSLHPVFSVAAIGAHKEDICLNVSRSNYGLESPVDRMLKLDVQVVRLGLSYAHNVYMHYAEALYGVPYLYTKILDADVRVNGKKVEGEFFATVRHLEYPLIMDFSGIQKILGDKKIVRSAKVGSGWIHRVPAQEYYEIAVALLKENTYAFLSKRPDFVKGEKPFDGITKERNGVPVVDFLSGMDSK